MRDPFLHHHRMLLGRCFSFRVSSLFTCISWGVSAVFVNHSEALFGVQPPDIELRSGIMQLCGLYQKFFGSTGSEQEPPAEADCLFVDLIRCSRVEPCVGGLPSPN